MNAGRVATEPSLIEREINERIAAEHVRLRFDKSAVRLLDAMKESLAKAVPKGQAIIFTVTAPIRRREKTAAALLNLVRDDLPSGEIRDTIEDNHVRLRRVTDVPAHMPKVLGFVHSSESDSALILELACSRLLKRA